MQFLEAQKNVAIDVSASGDSELIAAPTNGYIAIDHINLIPTSAVSVKLKRGSTELTGAYPLDAKQAFTIENPGLWQKGVMNCLPAEAFNINLGSAVQVSGYIRYRIIGE